MTNASADRASKDASKFRLGIFALLFFYIAIVLANAILVTVAFWSAVFGKSGVPWELLTAWAGATAGLGAGSLIFGNILKELFAT